MIRKIIVGLLSLALLFGFTSSAYASTNARGIIRGMTRTDTGIQISTDLYDFSNNFLTTISTTADVGTDLTGTMTGKQINDMVISRVIDSSLNQDYTLATSSIYDFAMNTLSAPEEANLKTVAFSGSYTDLSNLPTLPAALSFNNTPSHSIVTASSSANGFQLSATRNASVYYSVNVNTTATIAGNSDGYIVLEIAATNSATSTDWKEVSRTRNGQALSLALTLQSVQNIGSELMNIVPAGYYVRLRSVNVSGTPTYSFVSGQEVLL